MEEAKDYRLTIIMSNYNQEKYIEKALMSIRSQIVNFKYKIIITDDCSQKDGSKEFIRKYCEKYDDVEAIFSEKNTGYLENVIRAKKRTDTDYFTLLDADDYWTDERYLQRAFDFLELHKDYSIYEANVYVLPSDLKGVSQEDKLPRYITKGKKGTYTKEMFLNDVSIPITQTTGMFFRNTIFKNGIPTVMENAVGTLSERSFEGDYDRFIMHLKSGKAYYSDIPVGVYRITSNGIWAGLKPSERHLLNAKSYMDYYSFYQENVSFFAGKAFEQLNLCIDSKKNEIRECETLEELFSEKSVKLLNEVYRFCCSNASDIIRNAKTPFGKRLKKGIKYIILNR